MRKNSTAEPMHLNHFEDEYFREAIRRHVQEYHAHFGDRLVAIYVSGSVHRNEAVRGISDLDLYPFITDTFGEADWQWKRQAEIPLEREFGEACDLSPARPVTEAFLQAMQAPSGIYTIVADPADGTLRLQLEPEERPRMLARSFGILLRYDATLVWGRDLIEGLVIPPPDRRTAQVWFLSPWELTRFAAGVAKENRTDFDLPEEPRLRLHELAKLAKLGGAALLMARGEFSSLRYADVFPALKQLFPQWASFLNESTESYFPAADPPPEQISAYLSRLLAWMDWIGAQLYGDAALLPTGTSLL
jgi:hypothetical protein